MVEPVNDVPHHLAEVLEVKQQAGFVELGSGQRHPHLVVVPMRILALALVIPQVMARGKRIVNRDFEHAALGGSFPTGRSSSLA